MDRPAFSRSFSEIQKFFARKTILITGATGLIGKLLLEKLLRSCPDIKKVYLLIRLRYHYNTHQRLTELLDSQVFNKLREEQPDGIQKIELIKGDCSLPNLAITPDDYKKLCDEVEVVYHCAGTNMFDVNFRLSSNINVRAVRDLLALAKDMKNLKAFLHFSSIFVNCPKPVLDEAVAKPFISGKALLEFVASMDSYVNHTTPIALGKWPNNNVFTKTIAEDIVRNEGRTLPVVILRPALVIATVREPEPGWLDNTNGLTDFILTSYLGLNRSILVNKNNIAHLVPADYVVNVAIAAAWDVAHSKALNENVECPSGPDEINAFNVVASPTNAISWGNFFGNCLKCCNQMPTSHAFGDVWTILQSNRDLHNLLVIILHYIPSYFVDFFYFHFLSQTSYFGHYNKIDNLSETLGFFTVNNWDVTNSNVSELWQRLSDLDRQLFDFNFEAIDWDSYFENYIKGIRINVLKDDMETLPETIRNRHRRRWTHVALIVIGIFISYLCHFEL